MTIEGHGNIRGEGQSCLTGEVQVQPRNSFTKKGGTNILDYPCGQTLVRFRGQMKSGSKTCVCGSSGFLIWLQFFIQRLHDQGGLDRGELFVKKKKDPSRRIHDPLPFCVSSRLEISLILPTRLCGRVWIRSSQFFLISGKPRQWLINESVVRRLCHWECLPLSWGRVDLSVRSHPCFQTRNLKGLKSIQSTHIGSCLIGLADSDKGVPLKSLYGGWGVSVLSK